MQQHPELEPSIVETCIGEVEEPAPSERSLSPKQIDGDLASGGSETVGTQSEDEDEEGDDEDKLPADRYSYHAAIYKNAQTESFL